MRQTHKGFTLVAVMVALTILLLGAVTLSALQLQVQQWLAGQQIHSEALALARSKLEELRSFSRIRSAGSELAYEDIADNSGGELQAGEYDQGRLHLAWHCVFGPAFVAGATIPAYKQVDVQVEWRDGHSQWQTLTLSARLTPYQDLALDGFFSS
jgi:hypothetical protein